MNPNKRILIVDDMHESIIPLLTEAGYESVYLPVIERKEILVIIDQFEGLIVRSKTEVDKELIDAGTNLLFVARAGAGMDKVDEDYLQFKKIRLINAPEGNRDSLGEHALGMLLSLLHKISSSFEEVKKGVWNRETNRGIELKGKTVGIYGVGNMGMSFASKLRSLDCKIIGYDKYKEKLPANFVEKVGLEELMRRTEILSIHIPLYEETRHLFDESYLRKFEKLKILINTARGEILSTAALVRLLEEGRIYGAALDVLENEIFEGYTKREQYLFKQLTKFPNVLITPHVGGWTFESYQRINEIIVHKIKENL